MNILVSNAAIAPSDRAFNYGDGVFTTMHVAHKQVQLLDYHLNRLTHDTHALGILFDAAKFSSALAQFVANNAEGDYVLKVHVSAGEGGRGYARDPQQGANVRLSVHEYPSHYATLKHSGATLICAKTQLAIQPALAGIKHMNRLEQVLIKQEVVHHQVDDALVLDTHNQVVEASAGNIFFYNGDTWCTPSLQDCGVKGVVRQYLLDAAAQTGNPIEQGHYTLADISQASGLVITNALMGVMPVSSVIINDTDKVTFEVEKSQWLAQLLLNKYQEDNANFN